MASKPVEARVTTRDLQWLDDDDLPVVKMVLSDFHKSTLKDAGKDLQTALLLIVKKEAGNRPEGGARGLAQFSAFLLLGGESHWPSNLRPKESWALSAMASYARYQGASLLRGHDTVTNREDSILAGKVLKELGHWASTKYAIKALKGFTAAVGKHNKDFLVVLQKHNPDRKWDIRMANKYLVAATLTRLGDRPVMVEQGNTMYMLLSKVLLA
jgi:hypothetical protein